MPVCVSKRGDKYRVTECSSGRLALNKAGTALDGGGHRTKSAAEAQARAVNSNEATKATKARRRGPRRPRRNGKRLL